MIDNALAVYNGEAPLKIDAKFFESYPILYEKLKKAYLMSKEESIKEILEEIDCDIANNGSLQVSLSLYLHQLDQEYDKIPMFTTYLSGIDFTSIWCFFNNSFLSHFDKKYGYTPPYERCFGITNTRNFFHQDSCNPISKQLDHPSHLNQYCVHSLAFAHMD